MRMKNNHSCFEEKTGSHLYKIGMFAQMNHVTIKALRFYEEKGLLFLLGQGPVENSEAMIYK